jgi:DNA-binding XRE family transcriptional regulator
MNVLIDHQIIERDGQPLFVLVPYEEYLALIERDTAVTIPHDVVERHIFEGISLVRAWREYKRLSQQELAETMGVSQSAYSQMEKPEARLRKATLAKLASALGVLPEQLVV